MNQSFSAGPTVSHDQEINMLEDLWFPTFISSGLPLLFVTAPFRSTSDFDRRCPSRADGLPRVFISIASSMLRMLCESSKDDAQNWEEVSQSPLEQDCILVHEKSRRYGLMIKLLPLA